MSAGSSGGFWGWGVPGRPLLTWALPLGRLRPHAVAGAGCPFAFHQPVAINTVTFPTYCIYVSENVCVAYVMEQI